MALNTPRATLVAFALALGTAARADDTPVTADSSTQDLGSVQVTAKRLDEARQTLAPDLGADTFNFSSEDIRRLPAGASTPLNQVLLQAPGVVQDSFGQIHVRGDHGDLQFRINDVIIPESIGGFGQTLQTRFASNLRLITGALPAEYGYRTAGVVDITARDGAYDPGGLLGVMTGSHDTLQAYGDVGGTSGDFTYYVLGSWMQNGLGIESPTPASNPLHDDTTQGSGFAYLSYHVGGDTRLSLIGGSVSNRFQIPNVP
ncbi:MAG: TonB-dependent receptor, partial [Proteobacteria bacterium]|nr:TonB-dependent receptor [Pseudomonadota bacterium]